MDFSYSASDTSVRQQTPVGTPNFDHVSEERRRSSEIESSNSLGLSFALPSTIFFVEKPQVAIWDKTSKSFCIFTLLQQPTVEDKNRKLQYCTASHTLLMTTAESMLCKRPVLRFIMAYFSSLSYCSLFLHT